MYDGGCWLGEGALFRGQAVGHLHRRDIYIWQPDVVGEGSVQRRGLTDSANHVVGAGVRDAMATGHALTAGGETIDRHALARLELLHFRADFDDGSRRLVPHQGAVGVDGSCRRPSVQVRTADPAEVHLDERICGTNLP